ncbi:hypothetical protein AH396_23345 [Salmonella enterica subsp. enterica]|nr:hypothetical protein [Salmonella enterica subsp. enterica]EDQ9876438.1 hypothetical protein [Salmonella enterica subsp. enterica]
MLDKFLVLLERFVVAHELIAANSVKPTIEVDAAAVKQHIVDSVKGGAIAEAIKTVAVKGSDKPEPEDDLDDEEPEDKPKRKPRQAKPKEEPKGPDVAKLREEIKTIAKAIAAGDSDECADKFDELLEDYKVRTVTKLADEDVEAFHKDATKLVGKYYEIEE